jgi:hypothetical protein
VNVWFRDQRLKEAEAKSIAADQAERQNQRELALKLNYEAAEGFASVAVSVPADHPNTRSDLAISAVVSFASARRYDQAVQFARSMLAQPDTLSPRGRGELLKTLAEYEPLVTHQISPGECLLAVDRRTPKQTPKQAKDASYAVYEAYIATNRVLGLLDETAEPAWIKLAETIREQTWALYQELAHDTEW